MSRYCPICNSYSDYYNSFNCESFDNSYLYKNVYLYKCNRCGHIYNDLEEKEIENLDKYYKEEYAPSNLSSNDKEGDRPGTVNLFNKERYNIVYYQMFFYADKNSKVLDIGCATGGFLKFLKDKGFNNLYGIDPIKAYVDNAIVENIKVGNVYSIPFEDNSFDIIILDQVLEHLINPRLAMKEIKRVLGDNGLLYISVPDAERYGNEIYYYIMREHVQHFSLKTLKLLVQNSGFEITRKYDPKFKMIGDLDLPCIALKLKVRGDKPIYCFGIGREFMYLYENTRLKNLKLILIDDTLEKQKQTFKGMKIYSSEILKDADKDSLLIITANVHRIELAKKSREVGYEGEIIDI